MCATSDPGSLDTWRANVSAAVVDAHDQAVSQGLDGYVDPGTGLFVFTEAHLLAKGPCCESKCRHCPYKDWSHARP